MKELTGPEVVRPSAVAGTFYPEDPGELRRSVITLINGAPRENQGRPKALIVPHAGYAYSGPVAASAFRQLQGYETAIERVVLLGPSHRVPFDGVALCRSDAFATPLGLVSIDKEAARQLHSLPQTTVLDMAHKWEHSLEVELPFLQLLLGEFSIIPLVVGAATDRQTREIIDLLWGGPETLLIVSSDLSHYYDYETAVRIDSATAEAIEKMRPDEIGPEQACGSVPIRGLLQAAQARGLAVRTLDLRNSGDTAGLRQQVVGYGAFSFIAHGA